MKKLVLIFLPSLLLGQATPNALNLSASPPPLMNPSQIQISITGQAGTTLRRYWVIVNYPIGIPGISGPAQITNQPNTLSNSNYVTISWPVQSGATSYDLLETLQTEPNPYPGGTFTYALATGLTSPSYIHNVAVARTSYTVPNVATTATCSLILDNIDQATPYLYTNPCQLAGESAGTNLTGTSPIVVTPSPITGAGVISCPTCSSSSGTITGSGTAQTIPEFTSAQVLGNSSLTDNGVTVTTAETMATQGYTASGNSSLNGLTVTSNTLVYGNVEVGSNGVALVSGTYQSGGSFSGTGTCTLTVTNSSGPSAVFSIGITGGGTPTTGSALTLVSGGNYFTSPQTSATGSGTCTGTITIATALQVGYDQMADGGGNVTGWEANPVSGTPCVLAMPTTTGTSGQVLEALGTVNGDSSCNTGWTSAASGTVTSVTGVNGLTGTVTTSGDIGLVAIGNNHALCNNSGSTGIPDSANCTVTGTGDLVLQTSPALTTPSVTTINDANGNPFIASTATASAVDSLTVVNAATANPATVGLDATGTDSNINLNLVPKGTGIAQIGGKTAFYQGNLPHVVSFNINGNGATITTGATNQYADIEWSGVISKVVTTGTGASGPSTCSIAVDIWAASAAIPTSGNLISASDPATLSTEQSSTDITLTGWTTTVSAGYIFSASVEASPTPTCYSVNVQVWFK